MVFPNFMKIDVPIRPVVSFINAATYNLCGFLDSWFKSFTKFLLQYCVRNTVEIVDRIKDFNPPSNSILISFDAVSLNTNVPLYPLFD